MIIIDVILIIIIGAGAIALFAVSFGIFFYTLYSIGQILLDTAIEFPGGCCFFFVLLMVAAIIAAVILF